MLGFFFLRLIDTVFVSLHVYIYKYIYIKTHTGAAQRGNGQTNYTDNLIDQLNVYTYTRIRG